MSNRRSNVFGAKVFPSAIPAPEGSRVRPALRTPCYGLARLGFDGQEHVGVMTDVSATGAYVWIERLPPVGGRVEFALLQPGIEVAFACQATVVRRDEGAVALRFEHRSSDLPRLASRAAKA
ncbi:MAG: PilZ domain-containing protein [Deltaproteobacteria bacterium]